MLSFERVGVSRYIDESIEKIYSIRSDTINSAEDFENALASLHEDGEMERFRALLKQSIDSTSSRYNEMVMQILKDIVVEVQGLHDRVAGLLRRSFLNYFKILLTITRK